MNDTVPQPEVSTKTEVKFGEKIVSFGARTKSVKEIDVEAQTVSFYLKNGQSVTVDYASLTEGIKVRLGLHGIAQKIGDEAAGVDDIEDIFENFTEAAGRLASGEWSAERKAGEGAGVSYLVKALVEVTGQGIDQVRATLKTLTPADKSKLSLSDRIRPVIQRLKEEKAAQNDPAAAEALLAKFG